MTHLKQHVFHSELNETTDVCIYCGADLQEEHLPCDRALESAPDYFDREDPRWQAEEAETIRTPEERDEE
jgi:hypothetical protein